MELSAIDSTGLRYQAGADVVYPNRRGSDMWVVLARVEEILEVETPNPYNYTDKPATVKVLKVRKYTYGGDDDASQRVYSKQTSLVYRLDRVTRL